MSGHHINSSIDPSFRHFKPRIRSESTTQGDDADVEIIHRDTIDTGTGDSSSVMNDNDIDIDIDDPYDEHSDSSSPDDDSERVYETDDDHEPSQSTFVASSQHKKISAPQQSNPPVITSKKRINMTISEQPSKRQMTSTTHIY